jgi:hypothetical protein
MRSFVEKRRTAFFVEKSSIFLKKSLDISSASRYNNTRRQGHGPRRKEYADVAELADALDSGSSSLKRVWVQIPSSAPKSSNVCSGIFCFSDLFGMTSIVPLHRRGGFRIRPRSLAIIANVPGRWRALTPAAL